MKSLTPDIGKTRILQLFATYLKYGGEEGSVRRISRTLQERFDMENFYATSETMLSGGTLKKLMIPIKAYRNSQVLDQLERTQKSKNFAFWQIHNVFPAISPGAYVLAEKLGVPIIHYLHNYRFGCVNGFLFTKGKECTKCLTGNFIYGALGNCWHDSFSQSTAMALILSDVRRRELFNQVRRWVAISHSQKEAHVRMGIPEDKIDVIHHFLECETNIEITSFPREGYGLFIGRLSPEKGIDRLIDAWSTLDKCRRLIIAGEGPEMESLQHRAKKLGLDNIKFTGFIDQTDQKELWAGAAFSIIPSVWREPFGMVVLEAWSRKRPVVAHNIGALSEIVQDGFNGFLVDPEHVINLSNVLEKAFELGRSSLEAMGKNGFETLLLNYNKERWLGQITSTYRKAGLI